MGDIDTHTGQSPTTEARGDRSPQAVLIRIHVRFLNDRRPYYLPCKLNPQPGTEA